MAHESLYRKHRPSSFAEVAGQDSITKVLEESIHAGTIAHAYLFSGSRGLGKTSVARIFAREINATHYDEHDVHEVDAASNNSVEDIRALTEGVYTLPFGSTYKVYILDEVHMLSKAAWNAFLKTLEEPPKYVVFILATTELERVPETVQSRCQVFEFKKPTRQQLSTVISSVAKKEGYSIDTDASELIAMLADGSYRDALSILQKVLGTSSGKHLNRIAIEETTGAPKHELVHALIAALAQSDRSAALTAIETTSKAGSDMRLFLEITIETLRTILLIRYAPELRTDLEKDCGPDEFAVLKKFTEEKGITHHTLLAFLTASERIRYAPIPAIPLELAIFELFPESALRC